MSKFLVMFLAPWQGMDEWMKKPKEERDVEEKKMMDEWNVWTAAHAGLIKETVAAGKTKRVTTEGVVDYRNNLMLYAIAEAESHDVVARAFVEHPHFGIPEASIEVMAIRPI